MRWLVSLIVLCFLGFALHAQPPVATAKTDRTRMLLFETARITLAVEGSAPLRVELPAKMLSTAGNQMWRVRPVANAQLTRLPNNRERWEQVFRFDPVAVGDLAVHLAPIRVNGEAVEWPALTITVNKTLEDANPKSARPVTTIEELPVVPPARDHSLWLWVAGCVACAGAIVACVVFTRKRPVPPVPPAECAMAELSQLQPTDANGLHIAERVADIVRTFVERRDTIPATKLTTAELAEATHTAGWPRERTDTLRELLDECDFAKFANTAPTRDRCEQLLISARGIVCAG